MLLAIQHRTENPYECESSFCPGIINIFCVASFFPFFLCVRRKKYYLFMAVNSVDVLYLFPYFFLVFFSRFFFVFRIQLFMQQWKYIIPSFFPSFLSLFFTHSLAPTRWTLRYMMDPFSTLSCTRCSESFSVFFKYLLGSCTEKFLMFGKLMLLRGLFVLPRQSQRDVTEFSVGFRESCCGLNRLPPFAERDNKFLPFFHIFFCCRILTVLVNN